LQIRSPAGVAARERRLWPQSRQNAKLGSFSFPHFEHFWGFAMDQGLPGAAHGVNARISRTGRGRV
jgi:hypothetical protein